MKTAFVYHDFRFDASNHEFQRQPRRGMATSGSSEGQNGIYLLPAATQAVFRMTRASADGGGRCFLWAGDRADRYRAQGRGGRSTSAAATIDTAKKFQESHRQT